MGVINALVACQMCAVQAIIDSAINLVMIITSCSPAECCLKEQLSIFTTQALLELPKVARNSHGNSFIPGLSPLAGILLNHYCRLTATCVHLLTVDLYPITCKDDISTEMSCV